MATPGSWQQRFSRWFFHWSDRRAPRAVQAQLTQKNLYVFPNATGFLYLGVTLLIWLLGTNYQNNLILALSYFMVSLLVVAIYHSFANLAGLQLKVMDTRSAFAGEEITFTLELSAGSSQGHRNLELRWQTGEQRRLEAVTHAPHRVSLPAPSRHRGYLRPGRLLVQSSFPLGIIRCWSWINLDAVALVYPLPLAIDEPQATLDTGQHQGQRHSREGDDFSGLRSYRAGDPIKHIAWKPYAQNKGLFTKEYETVTSAEKWLDWHSLTQLQEERLAGLCFWALQYEQAQIPYGLRLPGIILPPAVGDQHLTAVLRALAQFNLTPEVPGDH